MFAALDPDVHLPKICHELYVLRALCLEMNRRMTHLLRTIVSETSSTFFRFDSRFDDDRREMIKKRTAWRELDDLETKMKQDLACTQSSELRT